MRGGGCGFPRRWRPQRGGPATIAAALLWLSAASVAAVPLPGDNRQFAAPGPETPAGVAVSSAALIENASAWDGRIISFAGEAVGEAMIRGDNAWLHVNDDGYQAREPVEARPRAGYNGGQAIWVPVAVARRVRRFGDYHNAGDVVRVIGMFHAACREHGGDMDIHATSLALAREGRAVKRRLNIGRLGLGLGLLGFAGALWLMKRHKGRPAPGML